MDTWIRQLKWIVSAIVLVSMLTVPAVVFGHGGRWSGMDPDFVVDGHQYNVTIYWPSHHSCNIEGPIKFVIRAPGGEFGSESEGEFSCSIADETQSVTSQGEISLETKTRFLSKSKRGPIMITAGLRSSESFPVLIKIERDGRTVQECEGESNELIKCGASAISRPGGLSIAEARSK